MGRGRVDCQCVCKYRCAVGTAESRFVRKGQTTPIRVRTRGLEYLYIRLHV